MLSNLIFVLALCLPQTSQRTPVAPGDPGPAADLAETFTVQVDFRLVSSEEDLELRGVPVDVGPCTKDGRKSRYVAYPPVARMVSDDEGRVRGAIEVPVEWRDVADDWIYARIEAPGYKRGAARHALSESPRKKPAKLSCRSGHTILGTVLASSGEPTEAVVRWKRDGDERVSNPIWTDAEGRFAMDYTESGAYTIFARDTDEGNAYLEGLYLDGADPPAPVELTLADRGARLSGRLVDPRGAGLAGMSLVAVPGGLLATPDSEQIYRMERAGGSWGAKVTTDATGRFEFPGLVPGDYDLYASWDGVRASASTAVGKLGTQLESVSVRAGGAPVELVGRFRRLEVVVFDHRGEVVTRERPEDVKRFVRGGEKAYLRLDALDAGEAFEGAWRSNLRRKRVGGSTWFPVEGGTEYLISWAEPGYPCVETVVSLGLGEYHRRVELHLPLKDLPSSLTLRVLTPEGTVYRSGVSGHDTNPLVEIFSVHGRRLARSVGWRGNAFRDDRWSLDLPHGRHRVLVRSGQEFGCLRSDPTPREPFLAGEWYFDFLPGVEAALDLRLEPGGHLDFGSTGADARTWWEFEPLFRAPEGSSLSAFESGKQALQGCEVELVSRDGRRLEGLEFELLGANGGGVHTVEWVAPGLRSRGITAIAPGSWTAIVRRGGRILRQEEVEIRAGEVTTLMW